MDEVPSWFAKHSSKVLRGVLGSTLLFGLGFVVNDRIGIEDTLDNHGDRLIVLENKPYATREDLAALEARLKDQRQLIVDDIKTCLNKIQRGRECD